MFRKGLSKDIILAEAVRMITEDGYADFSMRELAFRLGVKAASLYNHIDGIKEIDITLAEVASKELAERLRLSTQGKDRGEAFVAASVAHKEFAENNRELYKALLRVPSVHDERATKAGMDSVEPLMTVIASYGVPRDVAINFLRAHRSFMHGFVELEECGFLTKGPTDKDESYRIIIEGFRAELEKLAAEYSSGECRGEK